MKILLPLDPIDAVGRRALEVAASLRQPGDRVHLLHIRPPPIAWVTDPRRDPDAETADERALVARQLEDQARAAGIPDAIGHVHCGKRASVATDITEFIDANGIDLVIVPTNARKGLSRLLLGSVAEQVVRSAPCDVYLVRPR